MQQILDLYEPVSLDEMKGVRLMNRIDTKYVTTMPVLMRLLEAAQPEYRLQVMDGMGNMPYYTLYYDTDRCRMYLEHLHGKKTRQKIRIRVYEHSGAAFLEVKNKNNKGRTDKRRMPADSLLTAFCPDFIASMSAYSPDELGRRIENRFSRITLVNRSMTERLTIDTGLKFNNLHTGIACSLEGLAVIELKRDGHTCSPISGILNRLRIHPASFSKYCMGMALTDRTIRQNRFKPRLREVDKMCEIVTGDTYDIFKN